MADYTLKLSEAAREDIESIDQYLSQHLHNPSAARALNAAFRESLLLACATPYMYPQANNRFVRDTSLRKLCVKNYIIFYRPDDARREIQVVRVLYGMRNFKDIL